MIIKLALVGATGFHVHMKHWVREREKRVQTVSSAMDQSSSESCVFGLFSIHRFS